MAQPEGEGNTQWKGDEAGYGAIHEWVRRRFPRTGTCSACGTSKGQIDLANRDHLYRRGLTDWIELCPRCHREHDAQAGLRPFVTVCPAGHAYDEANTGITKRGRRTCRACARDRYHQRKRLKGYPRRPCAGCGCDPDDRTSGCSTCTSRHWVRARC